MLELGTGCGIHAILIAQRGAEALTVTEIDAQVNENARHNMAKNGVTALTKQLLEEGQSEIALYPLVQTTC